MYFASMQPRINAPLDFDFQLPSFNLFQLSNGIPVYYMSHPDCIAVQIEWTFEAGLWHESQAGIAQAAGRLLKNGTALSSELEINEKLEYLGASLRVVVNNDYTHITLMTLDKHLPSLLPIVKEIITLAQFDVNEVNLFIQNAKKALEINIRKNDFVANRLIEEQLFGIAHPYGRYMVAEDYDRILPEHLRHFHKTLYRYDNCKIFIAGGFRDEDQQLLNNVFGKELWNDSKTPVEKIGYSIQSTLDRQIFHEIDGQNVQSAIRLARHTIHRDDKDYLTLQFLNIIFGGYFGSRLMSNIREDKGYTYGIYSYLASHRHNSYLTITTEVDHQLTDATIHEIHHEMNMLSQELIPEEELSMAKNYVLGSLVGDMDGVFSLMQLWKSLILQGNDGLYFDHRIKTFKGLTSEDLQTIAKQYMRPEDYYLTVVH